MDIQAIAATLRDAVVQRDAGLRRYAQYRVNGAQLRSMYLSYLKSLTSDASVIQLSCDITYRRQDRDVTHTSAVCWAAANEVLHAIALLENASWVAPQTTTPVLAAQPSTPPDTPLEKIDGDVDCEACGEPSTVDDPVAHFKSHHDPAVYYMAHASCGEAQELELA